MSVSGDQQRLARREWIAARILLALGFIVIVAGFFAPVSFHSPATQGSAPASPSAESAPALTSSSPGAVFCSTAVGIADSYGTIPGTARATGVARKTDVQGRYACEASNGTDTFTVTVELECPNIRDQACFSLYTVKAADGTALYQRQ
jgi:hypothetical protein